MANEAGKDGICGLCLKRRELQASHIVPSFAGRYLKETSPTGFLRDAENPNIRRQDLVKEPLLCGSCEQVLCDYEREFSTNAFRAIQGDDFRGFEYGADLLKFAVSLSWRVLVTNRSAVLEDFPQFRKQVNRSLEDWRSFLLGERKRVSGEHHLFVISGIPRTVPSDAHPKLLHYLLRSIDATPVVGKRTMAVYVKLVRAMFYSPLVPASLKGWKNTRIHSGSARLIGPQTISMPGYWDFLNSRVQEALRNRYRRNKRKG